MLLFQLENSVPKTIGQAINAMSESPGADLREKTLIGNNFVIDLVCPLSKGATSLLLDN